MARPSPLTADNIETWTPEAVTDLMEEFINSKNNEKSVIFTLRLFLACGVLESVLRVTKIHRYRFEFSVGGGRVDLLLFHKDGGVSIIEAKAENSVQTISCGIGQLFMYSAQLPAVMKKSKQPTYVNKILIAPIEAEKSLVLIRACELAGVKFIHLAPYSAFKSEIDRVKMKYEVENGA